MDDSPVQTALCVIGHPIAGNPAQFCISRILQSLGMDWQCLSFDVPPESLDTAIAGIDVLHFAGALIAPPHQSAVARLIHALPSPALPSPALPPTAVDSADDTAKLPDQSTAAVATNPVQPTSQAADEPAAWCDALARDAEGKWELCNFIGETLLQLIREHEQRIGLLLSTCVFLGDQATFQSLMKPFQRCLPESTYCLGTTALQRWPASQHQADPIAPSVAQTETPPDAPSDNTRQSPDNDHATDPAEATAPAATTALADPLHSPLLLIRPQTAAASGKKSATKPAANQAVVESLLEDLHPQSLVVYLASPGVPWPIIRGQTDSPTARINPLDLEVGRIAAALHRWTGHTVDRDALAEAIEEYLEI